MNDDYLWDKTGEPDPEIQQLEEILGTLRYQPQPLEIPDDLQTKSRPRFFSRIPPRLAPALAIAATIVLVLLGLGAWLGLQRLQPGQSPAVAGVPNTPETGSNPGLTPSQTPNQNQDDIVKLPASDEKQSVEPRPYRVNPAPLRAANASRSRKQIRKEVPESSQLAANELQEGIAAKEQLMQALRVVSAKLNFAQRKTQNTNSQEPVHHQHKIG